MAPPPATMEVRRSRASSLVSKFTRYEFSLSWQNSKQFIRCRAQLTNAACLQYMPSQTRDALQQAGLPLECLRSMPACKAAWSEGFEHKGPTYFLSKTLPLTLSTARSRTTSFKSLQCWQRLLLKRNGRYAAGPIPKLSSETACQRHVGRKNDPPHLSRPWQPPLARAHLKSLFWSVAVVGVGSDHGPCLRPSFCGIPSVSGQLPQIFLFSLGGNEPLWIVCAHMT